MKDAYYWSTFVRMGTSVASALFLTILKDYEICVERGRQNALAFDVKFRHGTDVDLNWSLTRLLNASGFVIHVVVEAQISDIISELDDPCAFSLLSFLQVWLSTLPVFIGVFYE